MPKASSGQYIPSVLIDSAMKHGPNILTIEAPKGFMEWSDGQRKAHVDDWCKRVLKPELDKLDTTHSHSFGEDFARKGDLSIFVPLGIRPNLSKYVPLVVELRNMTYEGQRQILHFLLEGLPRKRDSILQLQGVISTEELGEVMAAAELAGISDVADGK